MYADSFDILINRLDGEITIIDTLYTKMYIALKTCYNKQTNMVDNNTCDTFYALYNQLRMIDTNDIWLSECTEMKATVQSLQGRKDESRATLRENYYRMPKNKWERASYLGMDYYSLGIIDSAEYYLESCVKLCDSIVKESTDTNERRAAAFNKWACLTLLNHDKEASLFVDTMLRTERDSELRELLLDIKQDKDAPSRWREIPPKIYNN